MTNEKLKKTNEICNKISDIENKIKTYEIDPFLGLYFDDDFKVKIENEIKNYLQEKVDKLKKEFEAL